MKYKLLTVAISLAMLDSTASWALTSTQHQAQLENQIQQVSEQTQALQKEVRALKTELRHVKRSKQMMAKASPAAHPEARAAAASKGQTQAYTQGTIVTTTPHLGIESAYDASDLLINFSTMNEDLRLLQMRQKLEKGMSSDSVQSIRKPLVILGGGLEAQAFYSKPYTGGNASDIDFTRGELDAYAGISRWIQGFLSLTYDNSPFDERLPASGNRTSNSRLYLKRGFMTIGDLNKSPFYASIGQMYVPFGIFSSAIVSDPDTKDLARTTERTVLLGYSKDGIYASTYAFNGPSNTGSNNIKGMGANLGYQYSGNRFGGNWGVGFINNLADSILMQDTYTDVGFRGFGDTGATENLVHRVPAADVHGQFDVGQFSLLGEYITPTRSFDERDLMFNYAGARPRAMHVEADYRFKMFDKPSVFALAYDQSWQGLALGPNMPKNSYIAAINTSIWRNTIESLEFRHDVNYSSGDVAGGRCNSATGFCSAQSTGGSRNTLLGQIGVYF